MINLFEIMTYLTDDDIRLQLAFFDCVTFTNAAKETGSRILSGLADVANSFAEIFSNKVKLEYDYKKVSDMVDNRVLQLKAVDREQLLSMLKIKLAELAGSQEQIDINTGNGQESLSQLIVTIAGNGYGINPYIAPAHKMTAISQKYNNAFMDNLSAAIKNMTVDQFKAWSLIMDRAIGMADIETKRAVHKELMPDSFNGMGVLKVLRKQKNNEQLKFVIECFGVEAFDYKTIEIRTMYQAIRRFNKISAFQFARLIDIAVRRYNRPLYAKDELMPSYKTGEDKVQADAKQKEYKALAGQVRNVLNEIDKCNKDIENKKKQLEEAQKRADKASQEYSEVSVNFSDLELKKDEYINGAHTENETKSYYSRVNDVKRQLDRSLEESEMRHKKCNELSNQVMILEEKSAAMQKQLESLNINFKNETEIKWKELKRLWSAYYYKFKFEDKLFEQLVSLYDNAQLVTIEAMLKEIHDSKNTEAYIKDGIMNVYTGDKKPAVIKCEGMTLEEIILN